MNTIRSGVFAFCKFVITKGNSCNIKMQEEPKVSASDLVRLAVLAAGDAHAKAQREEARV